MNQGTAWILSDDERLHDQLRGDLERHIGCRVDPVFPHIENINPDDSKSSPRWLFVDLRQEQQWDRLAAIRQRCDRLSGPSVPMIGIVDGGGLPTERAVLALRTLVTTRTWPLPADGLSELLRDATDLQREMPTGRASGSRVLEGKRSKFLTHTPTLFTVLDDLKIAAHHNFSILLVGETGTGKTTLAEIIHDMSPRRHFVCVSCGSLPIELIDSELFGHTKGAFAGALTSKPGKFDLADGGTMLLDEIDVLGLAQQSKLLRFLETGEFEPLGSNETRRVDTRSIVASNVCLESLIANERFRVDLYFRLNQLKFEIPPLRARPLDIVPLAVDFMEACCREHSLRIRNVHPDFLEVLQSYSWPGNVRQLRNEIRRAVIFCRAGTLTPSALSKDLLECCLSERMSLPAPVKSALAGKVAQTEQAIIERMLRAHNFNRAATSRALGISRVTLYNKIRKYGIHVDGSKSPLSTV